MMRHRSIKASVIAIMLWHLADPGAVHADDVTYRANLIAYDLAMKCFVANGVAASQDSRAGNSEAQAKSEVSARTSFDTATKLGEVLGYSKTRVHDDFELAQVKELPTLVSDGAHLGRILVSCKKLGLR